VNPAGFWEHTGVIALNDELLGRLGGAWFAPPALKAGWHADPGLDDLRSRGRELVQRDLATAEVWAWKDPRTCITLPFWRTIVPSSLHVVCLRGPAATARSLAGIRWANRHFEDTELAGLDLWLRYTAEALEHTEGMRRLLVFYDDLVEAPLEQSTLVAEFAGLGDRLTPPVERSLKSFLRPALRHHDEQGLGREHAAFRLYDSLRGQHGMQEHPVNTSVPGGRKPP
jgi:hypothetical protein